MVVQVYTYWIWVEIQKKINIIIISTYFLGYVLSKEALRRFVEDAIPDNNKCRKDHGGAEDVEMGTKTKLVSKYLNGQMCI